ncbi:MAG: RrF2 family transcriptional regulator [Syntrophothermus sp.]|nr:Rrf2 family transcriptional regulator [Ignavibacteriaceae bacterium]
MTVIFSKKCEYGLQAVLFISTLKEQEAVSAEDISKRLSIPKEFVSKILQSLTSKKIVVSRKGKSGGFLLGKPANKIKLIEIVEAIDGLGIFSSCVLGFPKCSKENPCPVHGEWGILREKAFAMLNSETLDKFSEAVLKKINNP